MQGFEVDACAKEDGGSEAARLFEHGGEQVFNIHLLIAVFRGLGLGLADGILRLFSQAIEIHGEKLSSPVYDMSARKCNNMSANC